MLDSLFIVLMCVRCFFVLVIVSCTVLSKVLVDVVYFFDDVFKFLVGVVFVCFFISSRTILYTFIS